MRGQADSEGSGQVNCRVELALQRNSHVQSWLKVGTINKNYLKLNTYAHIPYVVSTLLVSHSSGLSMEQNFDSPVMRFQCEAEAIEGLTSLSSHTQKSPKDTLASSFGGNIPGKTMAPLKVDLGLVFRPRSISHILFSFSHHSPHRWRRHPRENWHRRQTCQLCQARYVSVLHGHALLDFVIDVDLVSVARCGTRTLLGESSGIALRFLRCLGRS
jgi:hypothetical protein